MSHRLVWLKYLVTQQIKWDDIGKDAWRYRNQVAIMCSLHCTSCSLYFRWVRYLQHNTSHNCQPIAASHEPDFFFPNFCNSGRPPLTLVSFGLTWNFLLTSAFWRFLVRLSFIYWIFIIDFNNIIVIPCYPMCSLVGTSFHLEFGLMEAKYDPKPMVSYLLRASQPLYPWSMKETFRYLYPYNTWLVYFNT